MATISEDGKPWVRMVSARADESLTIRFAAFGGSRKIRHISANPEVHLTMGTGSAGEMAYLQIQGRATATDDEAERRAFWKDDLSAYFQGADDPQYRIVIVEPYRIELNSAASPQPEIWEK